MHRYGNCTRICPAAFFGLSLLALAPRSADGAVTTYGTLGAFSAAAGPTTLVDFEGSSFAGLTTAVPGQLWNTVSPAGFTLGGVTVTSPGNYLAIVAPAFSPSLYERGTGNQMHGPVGYSVRFTFVEPVIAVAFDFSTIFDRAGSVTVTFSTGDTATATAGDPYRFNGYVSSSPFTSINFAALGDYTLFDNIRYAVAPTGVPEPMSGLLLLAGLAALGAAHRLPGPRGAL